MGRRTDLSVYMSSEFCCEASSFIFLEGGTPSKSWGGQRKEERRLTGQEGHGGQPCGDRQPGKEPWEGPRGLSVDSRRFLDLRGASNPNCSCVHAAPCHPGPTCPCHTSFLPGLPHIALWTSKLSLPAPAQPGAGVPIIDLPICN